MTRVQNGEERGALASPLNTVLEQQFGLILADDQGPREFLVIDNTEFSSTS